VSKSANTGSLRARLAAASAPAERAHAQGLKCRILPHVLGRVDDQKHVDEHPVSQQDPRLVRALAGALDK